jgi:hypothetical protein
MSLSFYVNNAHFALELMGAVVFLMAAWLMLDSYYARKQFATIARAIGFALAALGQVLFAVNAGSDVLSYAAYALFLLGLFLTLVSFLKTEQLHVQAVIILPAFGLWSRYLHAAAALFLFGIAFLSFRQSQKEYNKTWIPFSIAFALLGASVLTGMFDGGNQESLYFIAKDILKLIGFALLAKWVWQYLQLRVRESLVLIFIAASLFLSTVVTLAFSTILVQQIATQTDASLLTDARVLDLQIQGLEEQAIAKTSLIAYDPALPVAIAASDFPTLEEWAERIMEDQKLGFVTLVDAQGEVLVRAHALSRRGDSLFTERAVEEALSGSAFVTVEKSPVEKLSIRAAAPIIGEENKTVGAIVAGYPLDNALVDSIKRLTGLDMLIYDEATSVAATAFAADGRTRLTGIALQDAEVREKVLQGGESITVRTVLRGQSYRTSYLPLTNGDDKIVGMLSAAKSEQDILDIENSTNRLTLITVVLIMLVLAWPIYLFTRRLTEEV